MYACIIKTEDKERGKTMSRQICVYVEDWQFEKLQKEGNKSEVARKAFDLYYKKEEKEMKIIENVELTKSGVKISDQDNPMAVRYFNDNGNLPDGNFEEDEIAGEWVHLEGKHTDFETYAYRSIDNSTLVPVGIFKKTLINQIVGTKITLTKAELENKAEINEVWEEIATESIEKTKENFASKEGWEGYDFTDDYLYQLEFDEGGIRYYEGVEERYLDIPVAEESWDEPQWSAGKIKMLIEGLK
jgi:hypothetical protein